MNNAGVVRSAPFDQHDLEDWRLVIAVNLNGAFYRMRAAVDALQASGRGPVDFRVTHDNWLRRPDPSVRH